MADDVTNHTAAPRFDPATVRRWLAIIHGDTPGHLHLCSTGDWTGATFPTTQLDPAAAYAAQLDAQGREGIYLRITSLTEPLQPGRRGGAADSAALPALWADLDLAGPGHAETDLPPDEPAGAAVLAATGLPPPTITVHSGGGLYPIWLLDQPWRLDDQAALDAAKTLAKDWQRVIEHAAASLGWRYGRGVGDLARVLRVPGTINRKAGLHRPCRITAATAHRYTVEHLTDALAAAVGRITPAAAATRPAPAGSGAPTPLPPLGSRAGSPGAVSPLDDFNARADWTDILTPAGWREHYRSDNEVTYWTRPGKPTGTSASTNALGTGRLHVFTTSAPPLEGGESYSKAGALAALEYGGDHRATAKALARAGYGTPPPDPAAEQRTLLADLLGAVIAAPDADTAAAITQPGNPVRPRLDVTNEGEMADWLRDQLGSGPLAGMFVRGPAIVYTPQIGEQGYQPLTDHTADDDGPAQIRPVTASTLASRVQYRYDCYRVVKRGDQWVQTPALFPARAARVPVDVPDELPHLRRLRGVIHTPVLRPDGTLLTAPGYDPATGLLHLPQPGLTVPPVPDRPTHLDVKTAVALLEEMVAGFPFVTAHHRANYLGLLFTPLLRTLAPPPYKLGAIEAHQPGSGKSLLATILRTIHGGVVRSELPADEAELSKQLAAILMVTTGPVVTWDNVSGLVRSSVLAGLLTERTLSDRPLGVTDFRSFANDRLWTVTGNNMALGGDLSRRTIGVLIDPGVPQPEKREDFAIPNLAEWVENRRGELLAALLTVIRAWVLEGQPVARAGSDGYARWVGSVRAILTLAGIPGTFDHTVTTRQGVGVDDEDWRDFLAAIQRVMGDRSWTVKELLGYIGAGDNLINPAPIALDELPDELASKAMRSPHGVASIAKSLGRWLANRSGRWAGSLCVRPAGTDRTNAKAWKIHAHGEVNP
jgi:hypothetical protein